jgi:cysteinyl-tRNA synthetase
MQADKFSKFDDEGVPTHDAKGIEISKELKNKLKKEFKKHEEKHQKWLEQKKSKEEKK